MVWVKKSTSLRLEDHHHQGYNNKHTVKDVERSWIIEKTLVLHGKWTMYHSIKVLTLKVRTLSIKLHFSLVFSVLSLRYKEIIRCYLECVVLMFLHVKVLLFCPPLTVTTWEVASAGLLFGSQLVIHGKDSCISLSKLWLIQLKQLTASLLSIRLCTLPLMSKQQQPIRSCWSFWTFKSQPLSLDLHEKGKQELCGNWFPMSSNI